ncbi:putative choline dehydrogenase [Astrocystis sublimbata]|nr:putative choline dehydrogenase [Astrocystis sublimbata]
MHLAAAMLSSNTKLPLLAVALQSLYGANAAPYTQTRDSLASGTSFDYVIVGSGPGGLVMANRLTEDPDVTVAIIEAGTWPEDSVGNLTTVPGYDASFTMKVPGGTYSPIDWGFDTTPQAAMNGQVMHYPRGKCLGGSTNLNYMAWATTSRGAMDRWADEVGDDSWKYDEVAKYYQKAMNFENPTAGARFANATPAYNPDMIAKGGPVGVTYAQYTWSWASWMATAMQGIGILNTDSFINGALNGSAYNQNTIDHKTGDRVSADRAYLRPYQQRPNLYVFDNTLAEKIVFDGTKATGVQTENSTLTALREVIISGGVFQSPQLLLVSGVGPASLLAQHDIKVVADRPGVGQNLDDQWTVGIGYRVNVETASTLTLPAHTDENVRLFNENQNGPLASAGGEYAGFEKIPDELRANFSAETKEALAKLPEDWPEVEYLSLPAFIGDYATSPQPDDDYNYATILGTIMSQTSRGNVSISSSSMKDHPLINPNYLATQTDLEVAIAIFRRMRQAWSVPELQENLNIGPEYYPGEDVQTDEDIEKLLRSTLSPVSHATSTCKMGQESDPMAVVDSQGRVFGTESLRVVDASVFPFLIPGPAPQAGVYMVSEKIAAAVKAGN